MKIGGCMVVKNEEQLILDNLRYHLDHQGFDLIAVVDNGSYDRTLEFIDSLEDPRVLLFSTKPGQGFVQGLASSVAALTLFKKQGCDWVLPFDADEFWISQEYATVRAVLENMEAGLDVVVTQGYCFHETELDDPEEKNPFCRLLYAEPEPQTRVVLHRMGDKMRGLPVGGHWVELNDGVKVKSEVVSRTRLARFHYRYLSEEFFRKRIMNQVEGNLIRFGEKWLSGKLDYAQRILNWYNFIRNGEFEEKYRTRFYWSRDRVEKGLREATIHRFDNLREIFPLDKETAIRGREEVEKMLS